MISELPPDIEGTTKTPTVAHLFNLSDKTKKQPEEKLQLFHHLVEKLLYLC